MSYGNLGNLTLVRTKTKDDVLCTHHDDDDVDHRTRCDGVDA